MENLIIATEILSLCIIFISLGLLLKGNASNEQKLMIFFMCGALIQNMGYLLELTSPTMEAAITAVKIQYLGSLFIPLYYCQFMFSYCYEKAPDKLLRFLLFADFFILIIVFTCDHHSFYYQQIKWLTAENGHHYLSMQYGPGYLLFLLFGCAIPYLLSIYALFRAILARLGHVTNRRYALMVFLSLLPTLALLAYAGKLTSIFDFTPAVLGLVLSFVVILVWSRRNYDFSRLTAEVVIGSMGAGIITLDEQKRLVSFNQAAAAIFTDLNAHPLGSSIEDMGFFPEDTTDESSKKDFFFNDHFYESHVEQIPDKNGNNQGYVILVLDVTDTRNYIEEIKRVRKEAEEANMAKSEFLANMSHEIRTPMNAIVGLSDIIMEESLGRKVYDYACDIKSASQSLLTIINDILDLSKVEAGKMELITANYYLKTIVDDVMSMMDIVASQHGLLLKLEFDTSIPCQYHGDEGRIKQILINILNNAVKFTKKGYIKLSIEGRPSDAEAATELLTFKIKDTGCGIRQENLEKIFENFKQVDAKRNRSVEGTGLGLAITKQLVELMKGTIEVSSVYGEGTEFTVTLPQPVTDSRTLDEMPETPSKKAETLEPFTVTDYKVLVVDDNKINRKVAIGFLKNYGFELTEAVSGSEAISLVKKQAFDLIFMDHMMPEMDGIEAVQIIRSECGENGRRPVIIALTANAMEGMREKFLNNGFQDFIAKPLDKKALHHLLLKWIPDSSRKPQVQAKQEDDKSACGSSLSFHTIHIRGIDPKEAMEHYTGTVTDYLELLDLYCADGRRKLTLLRGLLADENYKDYEIEVHGLKSASANLGIMGLSRMAKEHEKAAAEGDIDFIRSHSPELLSSYEKQLTDIHDFLAEQPDAERPEESNAAPQIDPQALTLQVSAALQNLKNFRSRECSRKIEELLECQLEPPVKERLKEILEQLKLYEDDAAEVLLWQLLEWLEKEDH